MSEERPKFVKFVSAVEGRLATRWGGLGSYFGATVATPDQVAQGAAPITWDTKRIYGLTSDYCVRYSRELDQAMRDGDLVERKVAEFEAQAKAEGDAREKRRKDRERAAEKEAAEREKAEKKAEAERKKAEKEAAKAAASDANNSPGVAGAAAGDRPAIEESSQ